MSFMQHNTFLMPQKIIMESIHATVVQLPTSVTIISEVETGPPHALHIERFSSTHNPTASKCLCHVTVLSSVEPGVKALKTTDAVDEQRRDEQDFLYDRLQPPVVGSITAGRKIQSVNRVTEELSGLRWSQASKTTSPDYMYIYK